MMVALPKAVEEQLHELATRQGRDVVAVMEDALRNYVESLAIADLDSAAIGEGQMKLLGELPALPAWDARHI